MTTFLLLAAAVTFLVGVAHSYLGERYLLMRLFRRGNLPALFGGTDFTQRTLRFAWHLTTVAWWGFAALFVLLAGDWITATNVAAVLAATALASAVITVVISRGRHLAWIALLFIGGVAAWAAW